MRNLVISAVGDESLHMEWIAGNPDFDLCLLYYGKDEEKASAYSQQAKYFYAGSGMKYHLIESFIDKFHAEVSRYEYVWLPDNDVSISTASINTLFSIAKENKLELCQPAMTGFISHPITTPDPSTILRYTNFVEVLAPLMSIETFFKLKDTFTLNYSGWGYDYVWPFLLGYPKNKIAIVDAVVMRHTKPIGTDYSRFPKHPKKEMKEALKTYKGEIKKSQVIYGSIPVKQI